jgi:hypothetical protein
LTKYFNVISVTEDNPLTSIPDVLIIPDRKEFSVDELFAIDRSIQQGSPAIFLIDGMNVNPQFNDYTSFYEEKTIMQKWMNGYGVSIVPALIADKNSLFLNYISDDSQRFNQYNLWFKGNNQFDLLWASPLNIMKKDDINRNSLIESSELSWINEGETDLRPDSNLEEEIFSGPYPVVVEMKGFFQPLFQFSESEVRKEGTILVIGSTLSFSDFIQNSGSYKNSTYLRNMIYKLLGKADLYQTAIDTIQDNKMDLDFLILGTGKNRILFLNLILFPLFLSGCYILLLVRRNKIRNV